ncbi:glycosyltransferase, partial [Hansschlegelia beijingensis]
MDPEAFAPRETPKRWDLSYLGTYSPDRQPKLETLLLEAARRAPDLRFAVAGSSYPDDVDWPANVEWIPHLAPPELPGFYAASRFTLNLTRADMTAAGYSPSVRLFEAAATGCPVVSDNWAGLDELFRPDQEIVIAGSADDVLRAVREWPAERVAELAAAARSRV